MSKGKYGLKPRHHIDSMAMCLLVMYCGFHAAMPKRDFLLDNLISQSRIAKEGTSPHLTGYGSMSSTSRSKHKCQILCYFLFTSEVGAGNNATPELTAFLYNKLENRSQYQFSTS